MRVDGVPGEFYFKALIKVNGEAGNWTLSDGYFKSKEEAINRFSYLDMEILWPVEINQDGYVMVPDEKEVCKP